MNHRIEARQKERAEIILFCAEGEQTIDVARKLGHSRCEQQQTHDEWLLFLMQLDRNTDKTLDLHVIPDNYATHKHPDVSGMSSICYKHKQILPLH